MGVAATRVAPLGTPAAVRLVEAEAVITLANLWFRGIWNRRGRRFEEAERMDLLSERDDPASKGWIILVRVLRGRYFNWGDASLNLDFFTYLLFRNGNSVAIEVS
jgi:hypothetical protein